MTKITLNPVNYYDISDIYSWEVDNRPLYDISNNIDVINTTTSLLGFYQELPANPETEPVGGFQNFTCAYVGANGLLYPIDISQSMLSIDYSSVPIYLVIAPLGQSIYKCLAFSASLVISSLYNNFLPGSIGNALKVGPGGTLVDQLYFDLYYSAYGYQNIVVGKILTPNTIAFGGNQVSTLTDNYFIAKNRNDSTTGLLTTYVDNSSSSVSSQSILLNTVGSSYPFIEYVHQIGSSQIGNSPSKVPVYFSSIPLSTNTNGSFTIDNVENVLNELHFASSVITTNTLSDSKFGTAGVNNSALLGFAQNYLLHSQILSANLNEVSQSISTSLLFSNSTGLSTNGLFVQFDTVNTLFGVDSTIYSNLPLTVSTALQSSSNGICFGQFKQTGIGAGIGYVTNSNPSNASYTDSTSGYKLADLVGSSALVFTNKNASSNAIISIDTDYILFNTTTGTFYGNIPTNPLEITNKLYVDSAVNGATNTANSKVPLIGTGSSNAITGGLFFDVTASSDTSTVLSFNSMINTTIFSSNPINVQLLGSPGTYQTIRGFTQDASIPATNFAISGLTGNEFATIGYVQTYVSSAISGLGSYVALTGSQNIGTGIKTFSDSINFTSAIPITINSVDLTSTPIAATITCNVPSVTFAAPSTATPFRLLVSASDIETTENLPNCLVTKRYVDTNVETLINNILGPGICATWNHNLINRGTQIAYDNITWWRCAVASPEPDEDSFVTTNPFSTYFTFTPNDGHGSGGYFTFLGIPDPSNPVDAVTHPPIGLTPVGATFTINVSDGWYTSSGSAWPGGIFRTQTVIAVQKVGDSSMTTLARNIHQDDTDGTSVYSLVGSSCSTVVKLNPQDKLYLLSENAEYSSVSIARIR